MASGKRVQGRLSPTESLQRLRVFRAPPPEFNPLKASKRQLTSYGLPHPPDRKRFPRQSALWQMHLGDRTEWLTADLKVVRSDRPFGGFNGDPRLDPFRPPDHPFFTRNSGIFTRPGEVAKDRIPIRNLSPQTSNVWSGAFAPQPPGEPLTVVYATFNVPMIQPPPSAWNGKTWNDGVYHCSTWVGIDGWGGPDVMQAGATSRITVKGLLLTVSYYVWVEFWPAYEVKVDNLAVSPGDMLAVTVCAPFSTTHGFASIANKTSGQGANVGFDAPAGTTLSGAMAEWIVENPGSTPPGVLGNYGSVVFHDCIVGSKTQERDLRSATPINMIDSGGNVISTGWIDSASQLECSFGP